ncbi:MAG: asparaginase [Candidatus Kerfeldbacteria bacterium]|nr:asparaginase [Candidatus Kerfeldbacteria bacterium]
MAAQLRKTIYLLFGGGASLLDRDGSFREVRTEKDVRPWMKIIPELALIADVKSVFLSGGGPVHEHPARWPGIATFIAKNWSKADGFILTQDVDVLPYSASALTLMLQRPGKPIILTGAIKETGVRRRGKALTAALLGHPDVGIRSNLVNAAQVATLDIAETAVLFGNRLLRGANVVRLAAPSPLLFESVGVEPLGRIDFGLKLELHRRRRFSGTPKLFPTLKTRILQVSIVPTAAAVSIPHLDPKAIDGVFVTSNTSSVAAEVLATFERATAESGVPICIAQRVPLGKTSRLLTLGNVTPAMGLVKFMWALGRANTQRRIQKLLTADVAGEIIHGEAAA